MLDPDESAELLGNPLKRYVILEVLGLGYYMDLMIVLPGRLHALSILFRFSREKRQQNTYR